MSPQGTAEILESNRLKATELLALRKDTELSEMFEDIHPVELTHLIASFEKSEQPEFLKHITGLDLLSEFITYAEDPLRTLTLEMLDDTRSVAVLRRIEIDDAAEIISSFPRRKQVRLLKRLSAKDVKDLTKILAYSEYTAGRIMTTLFLSEKAETSAGQALERLSKNLQVEEIDPDVDINYIYICDSDKKILGVCSLRELLSSEPNKKLKELMNTNIISVNPERDQEEVARMIADYDLSAIPVVSEDNSTMLGIVTVDDVIDVIEEEHTEDLLKLAGTEDQDRVGASFLVAFKSRLPWLLASWLGGLLGAILLGNFSNALEQMVTLAFFMPVVFGMGGNVGSQSSTITVSGIASGILSKTVFGRRLQKEAFVGASLGLTFGILLSTAAYVLFQDPKLSMIVGISIMTTMTCAASIGSILPLIFERLGFDPAVSSGPFVTTSTDLLSIIIYFSVATLFI